MSYPSINSLEFGSFLSYASHRVSEDQEKLRQMQRSKNYTDALKQDMMLSLGERTVSTAEYLSEVLKRDLPHLPFADFFSDDVALIPLPGHAPVTEDGLWVPYRLAKAMCKNGMGYSAVPCLTRDKAVSKSSRSKPEERPSVLDHFQSLRVNATIADFESVVLVDDVITRGSTLMGAANRLREVFPDVNIRAFTVFRTISDANEFTEFVEPVKGKVTLYQSGKTHREP